jgi:hypothetical protein
VVRALCSGLIVAVVGTIASACSTSNLDVGSHPATTLTPTTATGLLFGSRVTAWSTFAADGSVLEVGVRLPMSAVEAATDPHTRDPALSLAMPSRVSSTTFFNHLDLYWSDGGHGPTYEYSHFDLHFFRISAAAVDAIDCSDRTPVPASLLAPGYSPGSVSPECDPQIGFHASPDVDFAGTFFSKTMILGFYGGKTIFVEPMLTSEKLRLRRSFTVDMPQPTTLGGAQTRFPRKFEARFDAAGDAYDLVFSAFVTID